MAEIILPPEENEETPQVPELNIDKPNENSKVITIEFEAKKTNKVSTKDTNQQLYTTDTDAWFEFKETSLEGANGTYSVVFRNRHDGSIFQRTGDVVSGVAYYKIPHQEIRHAGAWRGQIVYALSNGDTTAREFDYDVKGHILDGKDVREIVVEDFETLMSQLRSMKDNAELELANLTQELENLIDTANQNEINETNRQANELARESAESVRVSNEEERELNEAERISKDSERDSKIEAVEDLQADLNSEIILSRNSATKSKEFTTLDLRLEEIEADNKLKANKKQEDWITPTLLNGFKGVSHDTVPQFYKNSLGEVLIHGYVNGGQSDQAIFILPEGYRPKRHLYMSCTNGSTWSWIQILSTGEVRAKSSILTMDGIIFKAVN